MSKKPQDIINEFNEDHTYSKEDCYFVDQLREKAFDDQDIADIILVLQNTCKYCWNNESIGCVCMRDD